MSPTTWLLLAAAGGLALYALFLLALLVLGRRADARALATLVPDCVVLVRRLLGDPRVPRGAKLLLAALLVYLVVPVDLVPDFLPVVGLLDDAILTALVLRALLRQAGPEPVRENWPGPERTLTPLLRLAGPARA